MVKHICPNCSKEFKRKVDLTYHIEKKKNPCQQQISIQLDNLQKFAGNLQDLQILQNSSPIKKTKSISCEHCNKNFSSIYTLNRHIEANCKGKRNNEFGLAEENKQLKSQIDKQAKEIEDLKKMFAEFSKSNKRISKKQINNTNSNNTNNITQNNQNNNINIILPYGKELEKIELNEVLDHMLTLNFKDMLQNLVKYIYLNDAKPENKNFVVNDLARNKCQYYNGEKWITSKANDEIVKIFENANSLFTDPFDRIEIEKTIEFIRKNKKYSEKYSTILKCKNYALSLFDETDKENIEKREELLSELKFIFYSHKDEILKIKL